MRCSRQVARLAGIPASVVAGAHEAGARMETKLQARPLATAVAHEVSACGCCVSSPVWPGYKGVDKA